MSLLIRSMWWINVEASVWMNEKCLSKCVCVRAFWWSSLWLNRGSRRGEKKKKKINSWIHLPDHRNVLALLNTFHLRQQMSAFQTHKMSHRLNHLLTVCLHQPLNAARPSLSYVSFLVKCSCPRRWFMATDVSRALSWWESTKGSHQFKVRPHWPSFPLTSPHPFYRQDGSPHEPHNCVEQIRSKCTERAQEPLTLSIP